MKAAIAPVKFLSLEYEVEMLSYYAALISDFRVFLLVLSKLVLLFT